ncbi:hypothetical protein [Botrimarina mediterranea]|uniref:Uncharacterized protein n=1 Tax=Botrimarina mediterranea TaxID=2528022 RepID=A0A518K3B4_9BACT|nr:hypothetical protein [Botrimarina mediterranea]QDV72260.1 hypothetical protein Spa11_04340 [Botrimarina mediterranea]QDV76804.1 hypothetical protein K2D_03870 [Planctomycetes bacterium K2D]
MIVTILLGVVTLFVLVGAFFASKYWHWAHVLVLVAFYFAAVGYAILAARSLDTRLQYQKQLAEAEVNLEQQVVLNDAMKRGTQDPQLVNQLAAREILAAQDAESFPGVVQQEHVLRMQNRSRGRVWRNVIPLGAPNPETGAVEVGFNEKRPAGAAAEGEAIEGEEPPIEGEEAAAEPAERTPLELEPDSIVYVFEAGPLEGTDGQSTNQYLGEFRIDSVEPAARTAVLEPLDHLATDPYATDRLIKSSQRNAPWIVYRSMPADDRDLFAGMDEETLRRLLPEQVVEEYLRDGTPAQPDDPEARLVSIDADGNIVPPDEAEERGVAKIYRRRMRDYALILNNLEAQRAELVSRRLSLESDIAKLNTALAGAKELTAYREQELAKWQADFAAVERERQAINSHKAALLAQVDNARRLLDQTLEQNAQLASARLSERGSLTPIGPGELDVDAL